MMAMLWFYCDESYDSPQHKPPNYCVAGLLGEEETFRLLEKNWAGVNERFGVRRSHASPLNARDGEYAGWDKDKQRQYSKRLVRALQKRGGNLQITSIGMHADSYRELFSEAAKERFGPPYIACFKMCIAMLASYMRDLPEEYRLSVIFERNEISAQIVAAFNLVKSLNQEFGSRLATCIPGQWAEDISLQPADLVAYESMRIIKEKRSDEDRRWALKQLFSISGFMGYYLDSNILAEFAKLAEQATCLPGGWVPVSPQFDPYYANGDTWHDLERKRKTHDRARMFEESMKKSRSANPKIVRRSQPSLSPPPAKSLSRSPSKKETAQAS